MVATATPAGNQERESGPESQQAVLSGSFDELESMDEMEYTIFRLFGETKLFSNITRCDKCVHICSIADLKLMRHLLTEYIS